MKLDGLDLDELYREASGTTNTQPGRLGKVLAIAKDASSEEGKSPETVAAIQALKKLIPGTIAAAIVAVTLVMISIIYTVWNTLHGSDAGGAPLIIGALVLGLAILGIYYVVAKRTFGKPWYDFRDSIDL